MRDDVLYLDYLVLPGIYGSDEHHWQTLWEERDNRFRRFAPSSWDHPDLADWEAALSRAVVESPGRSVLVAHSLANILVGHWAARSDIASRVAGAFLVSVPDPSGPHYPADAPTFTHPPEQPLPFASMVIASDDDPYGNRSYTERIAHAWGSHIVHLAGLGHINSSSGLGAWASGVDLLDAFVAGLDA